MSQDLLAAHRLVLDAPELAVLGAGTALPPGFGPEEPPDEASLRAAAQRLRERGIMTAAQESGASGVRPVDSIAANLAVLAAPVVSIRVQVAVPGAGLRAVYTVSGPLGASLFALDDAGAELSMFAAAELGRELLRAVPEPEPAAAQARICSELGVRESGPPSGRLPLSALDEPSGVYQADRAENSCGPDRAEGSADELALAERARAQTVGTLWALVTGRAADGGVLVGQVLWLLTGGGWVGLRPDPDSTGRRMVVLVPVARQDLGQWLAPLVAHVLEVAGDLA